MFNIIKVSTNLLQVQESQSTIIILFSNMHIQSGRQDISFSNCSLYLSNFNVINIVTNTDSIYYNYISRPIIWIASDDTTDKRHTCKHTHTQQTDKFNKPTEYYKRPNTWILLNPTKQCWLFLRISRNPSDEEKQEKVEKATDYWFKDFRIEKNISKSHVFILLYDIVYFDLWKHQPFDEDSSPVIHYAGGT